MSAGYIARIQKVATGETRDCPMDYDFSEFEWTDGNYGCDCNRKIFFDRAKGVDSFDSSPCGTGDYSAIQVVSDDGTIIYQEQLQK